MITHEVNTNAQGTASVNQSQVLYNPVSKKTFFEKMKDALPAEAHPSSKTPKILGLIFLLVVIIGIAQFPLTSFLGDGSKDVSIKIGIPWTFLEFKLYAPEDNPLSPGSLILDVLLYVILAYALDIAINIMWNARFLKSDKEKKALPKTYKDQSKPSNSVADKVTQKMFGQEHKI